MTQRDAVTKSYESLLFLIPKLNGKHRKVLENHLEQVYVAGYEYGRQIDPRSKPLKQLVDGVVINRYRGMKEAIAATGKSKDAINHSIRNKSS